MKKYLLLLCSISVLFVSGCISSDIPTDQKIRIVGIVDACKNAPDKMDVYLDQKVDNKEISEIVSFTIKECLKTDEMKSFIEIMD